MMSEDREGTKRPTVVVGGVPYALHVKRLEEDYPVNTLEEGRVITHQELEICTELEKQTIRYYGVINSWMRRIRDTTGVFMVWDMGVGVRVLAPAEVLEYSESRTKQKLRQTGKAIRNYAYVDRKRLDSTGQARLDHMTRLNAYLKSALDKTRRDMAVELAPIQSLPKRRIK